MAASLCTVKPPLYIGAQKLFNHFLAACFKETTQRVKDDFIDAAVPSRRHKLIRLFKKLRWNLRFVCHSFCCLHKHPQ